MKMSELILKYGDDSVRFQNLDTCADSLNMGKKNTKITFSTDQRLNLKGTEQLGLILWFDRKKIAAIMAESKKATSADDAEAAEDEVVREIHNSDTASPADSAEPEPSKGQAPTSSSKVTI